MTEQGNDVCDSDSSAEEETACTLRCAVHRHYQLAYKIEKHTRKHVNQKCPLPTIFRPIYSLISIVNPPFFVPYSRMDLSINPQRNIRTAYYECNSLADDMTKQNINQIIVYLP